MYTRTAHYRAWGRYFNDRNTDVRKQLCGEQFLCRLAAVEFHDPVQTGTHVDQHGIGQGHSGHSFNDHNGPGDDDRIVPAFDLDIDFFSLVCDS